MKKKKGLWITLGVIAALVILIFAVSNSMQSKDSGNAKFVQSGQLEMNEVRTTILTSGRIQPVEQTSVSSQVSGKVAKVLVKKGDNVKKGDVLVSLDKSSLENQIAMQELRLKAAEINLQKIESTKKNATGVTSEADRLLYEDAKKTYEQKKELFQSGAVSKSELDGAKTSMDRAYMAYKASSSNANSNFDSLAQTLDIEMSTLTLDDLKDQLEKADIKAEKAGVITELNVKENDYIQATVPFGMIEDTTKLKMVVNINEFDIKDIQKGQRVTIIAEGNNREYEGKISDIAPKAELRMAGQSYETVVEVTIAITNPEDLKINFSANAEIHVSEPKTVLTVSYDALGMRDGQNVVFRINKDNKVQMIPITLGMQGDIYVEIISEELKEGDAIVLNPGETLEDGDLVKEGL